MPNNDVVTVTLSKAEAEWLYDLLSEKFDEGGSTVLDTRMSCVLAERIDASINGTNI